MNLCRLWRGEIPLDDAFWTYAVFGGIAVNVVTSLGFLILATMDQTAWALIIGYGLSLPYNLVAVMGVWRAAERDESGSQKVKIYPLITILGMVLLSPT